MLILWLTFLGYGDFTNSSPYFRFIAISAILEKSNIDSGKIIDY
jgi:hypothetical protein